MFFGTVSFDKPYVALSPLLHFGSGLLVAEIESNIKCVNIYIYSY